MIAHYHYYYKIEPPATTRSEIEMDEVDKMERRRGKERMGWDGMG